MHAPASHQNRPYALYTAAIIIAVAVIRIIFVATGQLNLVQDESQYWDWTRHLQLTYYSKGPFIAWWIALWTKVFGNTELGVRFGSIVGMAASQSLIYLYLSKSWKRPDIGFVTVAIMQSMPLFLGLGILMTTDNSFIFFWTASMFAVHSASIGKPAPHGGFRATNMPFVLMAITFGIGILCKYTMLGFLGLSFIFAFMIAIRGELAKGFWWRYFLAILAGLIIGFLPTFIWNYQNDWVGYKHVFYLIGVKGKHSTQLIRFDRFPDYIGSQIGLATPWWLIFMLMAGVGTFFKYLDGHRPALASDDSMTFRQATLLGVFFWPVWLFFLLWSFHAKVMPNWTTVSYVAGSILAAFAFTRMLKKQTSKRKKIARLCVGLSIFIFIIIHFGQHIPVVDQATERLKGWTNLGEVVDEYRTTKFKDPNKVFIFSDLYDITAALAFYVPGQPRTYCAWIDDRRMNQYDIWDGPAPKKKGWDAIMVHKRYYSRTHPEVAKMFKRVEGPFYVQTKYRGKDARKFTVYLCYDFNGYWPKQPGSF